MLLLDALPLSLCVGIFQRVSRELGLLAFLAGEESGWESPPFEASERDGAIFGRGTADSKPNILLHVAVLRAWNGQPPVEIKLLIEGQEEVGRNVRRVVCSRRNDALRLCG